VVARHSDEEARAAARDASAAAALVGSYDYVAQRLDTYLQIGVERLILRGYPHLEEAYRLGEHVLPKLSVRRVEGQSAPSLLPNSNLQLGSN
jgi:alkanesulfonate monooxygenase